MPAISDLPPAPAADLAGLMVIVSSGATYKIPVSGLLTFPAGSIFTIGVVGTGQLLFAPSGVHLQGPAGQEIDFGTDPSINIAPGSGGNVQVVCPSLNTFYVYVSGFQAFAAGKGPLGTAGVMLGGNLFIDFAHSASTPGSIVATFPIYDMAGSLIGYVPLYDSIT